jgi:hypothetical protein
MNETAILPIGTLRSSFRSDELTSIPASVSTSSPVADTETSVFTLDFVGENSDHTEGTNREFSPEDDPSIESGSLIEITASGSLEQPTDADILDTINKHKDALTKAAVDQLNRVLRLIGGNLPKKDNSGHLPCDVRTLGLSADQLRRIDDILADPLLKSKDLQRKAKSVHSEITAHLVYRYLVASGWAKTYNGKP